MPRTQANRWISVATPLGDDVLLLKSFSGSERLSGLFQFNLDLLSENPNIRFEDLIGRNITVVMRRGEQEPRYFNGHVSRFVQTTADPDLSAYSATVVPWLWFLTRTADCRIFQDKTVPEIIKEVFRGHGFSDFKESLTGTYQKWEYCVQYRETDFQFVSRLMEQEGIYYFFVHENGKHTLVLADAPGAHKPVPGYETFTFRPPSAGVSEGDVVTDWIVEKEVQTGIYALSDFDFKNPRKDLQARAVVQREHDAANFEVFDYPGEYDQAEEGAAYARARVDEWQAQYEVINATADIRAVSAGFTFSLAGHPREDQNREYLVIAATFQAAAEAFGSAAAAAGGESFTCSLVAIPADQQFRPPRVTPRPVVQGPQTAIVVGKQGEEIWTDEHGRVKVKFHWDRDPDANETSSCWIRVAQAWAGKKWGAVYIPRVGHEVIVEFLEGDPDQPIITGRVYNGDAKPPYDLPANATVSTIKSYSSKGGQGFNEIRFEDRKDKEQVFIHSQRRMDLRVRANLYETVGGNREERVGADDKGCRNEFIAENLNTITKGHHYHEVEKTVNQTIKDDVILDHQKNHHLMVKDLIQVNADKLVIEMKTSISEKSGKVTLEGTQELHLKGTKVFIEGTQELNIKSATVNIEGSMAVNVKGGMQVNIEAGMAAGMKVGGNFFAANPAGAAIMGTMVMINSGGSAGAAQAAKAAGSADAFSAPTITGPIEAYAAATALPGQMTGGRGGTRTNQSRTLKPQLAPPPPPPPPPPETPIPEVEAPKQPCEIKDLVLQCEHQPKPRMADDSRRVLQIVPSTNARTTEVSLDIERVKCTISGSKTAGGKDELTLTSTSVDGMNADLKTAHCQSPSPPSKSDYRPGRTRALVLESPSTDEWWPYPFAPEVHYLYGIGCRDDAPLSCTVEVYPSIEYKGSIECTKLEEALTKEVSTDQHYGFKASIEIKGPKGGFEVAWGWKEHDDWRACYFVNGTASVTLVTLTGTGQCNLRDILIAAGLQIFGVPMKGTLQLLDGLDRFLDELDDLKVNGEKIIDRQDIDELLGILMLTLTAEVEVGLEGSYEKKFFPSGGSEGEPDVSVTGGGKIAAEVVATKSLLKIVTASLSGKAEGPFEAKGSLHIETDGLYMDPSLEFMGGELTIELTFRLLGRPELKKELYKYRFMEPKQIFPKEGEEKKWKLLPR